MWICLLAGSRWLWHWPLWQWMAVSFAWKALFQHMLTLPVCLCLPVNLFFPSLLFNPHPFSHRACVSDPGRLSAGGTTDPGGWGLVRVSHPSPGQQDRQLSKWHMDLPLHHRCSSAGCWGHGSHFLRCWFRLYLEHPSLGSGYTLKALAKGTSLLRIKDIACYTLDERGSQLVFICDGELTSACEVCH